ncbi:TadE/TadG family type IV pilus assembly protein [Jannaschia sp. W003]|uniref:TadE/TadG family type IV pilus assembly protein n=1 Tax=Jannaschia sp. W003 TaxID=2867012 RepID=UPI0021A30A52|nr:TadE/TadG family type IV pilus assembly protein [Jannaschia sp. W003]UWQ20028.1 pilus assembly protein [Jannaschia sp. W003]
MRLPRPVRALARSLRDERGSIAVEAVIILPVLVLFYLVSFTLYNAYHKQTVVTKAGYTLSDLLSRQNAPVTANNIDGMRDVFAYITRDGADAQIRVTHLTRYVDTTAGLDEYRIIDSYGTGDVGQMSQAQLDRDLLRVPNLASNEHVTVIETFSPYTPPFFIGLDSYQMESFVVSRQRSGMPIVMRVPPLGTGSGGEEEEAST